MASVHGYNYGLGFAGKFTQDEDGKQKAEWNPAIYIDYTILDALQQPLHSSVKEEQPTPKLRKGEHVIPAPVTRDGQTSARILSGMHTVFALTLHDYIHNAIYSDWATTAHRSVNRPQDMKRKDPGGAGLSFMDGAYAPIYDVEGGPEAQQYPMGYSHEDRVHYHINRYTWHNGRLNGDEIQRKNGIDLLELHAEATHRDIMQGIFASTKSPYAGPAHPLANTENYGPRIKRNIIRQGTEFLDSLEDFRQRIEGSRIAIRLTAWLGILRK